MASPSAVFTELTVSTFRKHRSTVIDGVSKHNALWRRLSRKGRMRTESGGTSIAQPFDFQENGTFQRYSDFDVLNVQASEVFTGVEYPWRQAAINVAASGREMRINNGPEKIFNLAKARITNAMRSFANNMSIDMYSSGALANQIGGLQLLVADNGLGTVGGVDSSAAIGTFWRNKVQSAAAPLQGGAAITVGKATMENDLMAPLWVETTVGNDQTDLIVASNDYFLFFEAGQTSIKRYVDETDANAGFLSYKYKNADVIFDGNGGLPAAHMYFLNTDYLELVAHSEANLTVLPEASTFNQDAVVIPVIWMGNLVCTHRARQGVIHA